MEHVSTKFDGFGIFYKAMFPLYYFEISIGNGANPKVAWSVILGKTSTSHAAEVEKNVPLGKLYSKQYLVFTFRFPSIIQYNINLSEYT